MTHLLFIKRIRQSSLLSFILPLIAINLCWILYFYLGNLDTHRNISWNDKLTVVSHKEFYSKDRNLLNCPEYSFEKTYKLDNGKKIKETIETKKKFDLQKYPEDYNGPRIEEFIFEHNDTKNSRCIKKYVFFNFLIKNFNLEKLFLKIKDSNTSGFAEIRNPYFYGDVSISRTARYFPANVIFKPFVILSAFFLLIYWLNNLRLFERLKKNSEVKDFSKKFFYFGILSCVFLILHSIFLGVDLDYKIYKIFRKTVIIFFILFEVLAQVYLTINLLKLSNSLNNFINPTILKIKVLFVIIVTTVTAISFYVLVFNDPSSNFKHILEWNYFSFLLIYYFLSFRLWKFEKP